MIVPRLLEKQLLSKAATGYDSVCISRSRSIGEDCRVNRSSYLKLNDYNLKPTPELSNRFCYFGSS